MKNLKINIIIQAILIFAILISAKSFAVSTVNKNLNLSLAASHLLIFDEKIIRYKFINEKDFKAEILSNIFNNRQELLIKPLKKQDNKLTVWTASRIYNFNIEFGQDKALNIREIQEKGTFNEYKNAKPVASIEDTCGMADFDLDNPPKMNKNNVIVPKVE